MPQRKFDVDTGEYPFHSRWFEHNGSAMHYVDEGQSANGKITVVMCHGNPTWSFLYRHIIKKLSPHFRCIAYDLPGFGFSDHPPGYSYMPQEHAAWVEALLIDHLKLERFILIAQDWGGPIGLRVATRHPDRIIGMVLSSTFIGAPTTVGKIFSTLMGTRLGQYLIRQHNFFARTVVAATLGKQASPATLKAYTDPFPTPESRVGPAVFPVQIVGARAWLEDIERDMKALACKPVEFVFGLKDIGTRPADMARWLRRFPEAGVQKIPGANHFTQEDCPESYVIAVERIASKAGATVPA